MTFLPITNMTWQAYCASVQCNCSGPDPVAAQAACPIHAYNTGHLSYVQCNLISPSAITRTQGCSCPPVTPAQAAAFVASGGLVLIPASTVVSVVALGP